MGAGTQESNWAFTTTQDASAQYRVSYELTWFETHDDADASNDTVVGRAVIRPSEASENVCNTTAFGELAARGLRGARAPSPRRAS